MSRAALDESLARLDAALGTTASRSRVNTPTVPLGRRITAATVSSILDGRTLDTSMANTESPFANLSGLGESVLGNGSFIGDEVTAPVFSSSSANQTQDLTVVTLPAHHNAQVLFSEFVRVLVGERCEGGSEGGVWGEVEQYEALCHQQVLHVEKIYRKMPRHHHASARTKQVLQQLTSERNMWRLVRSLYMDRQCRSDTPEPAEEDETGSWLKSDQVVVSELYDSNRDIREAQLVVDWLEKSTSETLQQGPEKLEYFSDSHVAWENTLRAAKARSRGRGDAGSDRLITSLDPDAPVRQGKALHDLDQEDERVLVQRVIRCVRSGAVFEAQDKSAAAGQHWRAAAIEGWKLHHDPNVTDPTKRDPVHGNPYRDVWKLLAWKSSEDPRLSHYQRALYGALCGNLNALLLICQDWDDLLWAHTRVMADQRVEERLRTSHTPARTRSLVPLPQQYPERRISMRDVFDDVEKLCSDAELKNPHYTICKQLVLDDMDALLDAAETWLQGGPAPHLLRCLTHLLLVLRRMCRIVEPRHQDVADRVLHACVKAAIERGDVEQVAWYTAMLPHSQQVSCYAGFLLNITDPPQRRHALHLAQTVGLDTAAIATTTASIIRLSPGGGVLGDSDGLVGETVQADRIKIAGLDWLLFDDDLRQEALLQGLALTRTFLIARKMAAANMAMDKLPSDTLAVVGVDDQDNLSPEVEAAVREYLCIKTFLSAQECFGDWFDHFHQQKPSEPPSLAPTCTFQEQIAHEHLTAQHRTAADRWQTTLDSLTETACERLYNVLLFPDGGWLVDPAPLPHNDTSMQHDCSYRLQHLPPDLAAREPDRDHQLVTLRSIYIPQACSLLQSVLCSTNRQQQCLQLADVIASEQHQLYSAFGSAEMQRFLLKLLEPTKQLLDNDKDPLGYPLH